MSSTPPDDCRWRFDDKFSATLDLPDGRKLGYAEYGVPSGAPIFYLHGYPGCRLEAAGLEPVASKVGARIIAIDRPAMGWSTPHENRTLLDHARDVETLANHLRLEKYGVLGISGGGPYALACARALPADKLRAVSIVCGLGSPDMGYWGMNWTSWLGWTYGQRLFPRLCAWWMSRDSAARLDLSQEERMKRIREGFEKAKAGMHPRDRPVLGDANHFWLHLYRGQEVFRHGTAGLSDDFRVLSSDLGFRIEDIRKNLPVQIWHGENDVFVPLQHGQKVATRLGANAKLTVTDDTHASIWAEQKENYLGELVKAVQR